MAVQVTVEYQKRFSSKRSLEDTYKYLADVKKSVPECFPGLEKLDEVKANTYRWSFEKVGFQGYEIAIKLVTEFGFSPSKEIHVTPVVEPGACLFKGGWNLSPEGDKTQVDFKVNFQIELPVPGFLKAVAVPLTQKELQKLFDRYVSRAEKNLST